MADKELISVGLQQGPVDHDEAMRFVANPRAGGVAVFAGVTRLVTGTRETTLLSYDAYEEMAEPVLRDIAEEVIARMEVCNLYIRHRTGVVPAGEASVLIAVSAPHRAAAFDGCRYVIDELKKRAPIWKKEHFADGTTEWVKGAAPGG